MTLLELKKSLHEQIDVSNNPQVLEKVAAMLKEEKVFIIPEHMLEGIKQGQDDIKNGRVHTQEDFDKKYKKWLKG
jgi:hypothetical protein